MRRDGPRLRGVRRPVRVLVLWRLSVCKSSGRGLLYNGIPDSRARPDDTLESSNRGGEMTSAAKTAVNVQHSSASDSWATPADIVERARHVLGGVIDLDPASDSFAQETVRATRYITREENGLVTPWHGRAKPGNVFLNPPGGKDGKYSRTGQ